MTEIRAGLRWWLVPNCPAPKSGLVSSAGSTRTLGPDLAFPSRRGRPPVGTQPVAAVCWGQLAPARPSLRGSRHHFRSGRDLLWQRRMLPTPPSPFGGSFSQGGGSFSGSVRRRSLIPTGDTRGGGAGIERGLGESVQVWVGWRPPTLDAVFFWPVRRLGAASACGTIRRPGRGPSRMPWGQRLQCPDNWGRIKNPTENSAPVQREGGGLVLFRF